MAQECLVLSDAAMVRGQGDESKRFALLGYELCTLAERGGGLVTLLYLPGPPEDWQLAGDVKSLDGTRPWRCPDSCRCRAIPLIGRRTYVEAAELATVLGQGTLVQGPGA